MHLLAVLATFAATLAVTPGAVAPSPSPSPSQSPLAAATVLHQWDARRQAAWAADDGAALRRLYVRGSPAGAADTRLLHRYAERGLVVRRIVTQVFELHVLHADAAHLRLRVVDRVAGGLVGGRPLGTTPPRARVISFRRTGGQWQVVSVQRPARR